MFRTARVGSVEELLLGRVSSIEGMLWKKGKGAGALGRRNWKMRFFVLIASRDGAEDSAGAPPAPDARSSWLRTSQSRIPASSSLEKGAPGSTCIPRKVHQ